MELIDFLLQTRNQVRAEVNERVDQPGTAYPFPETVFTEIVMQHMADVGMTFEPEPCHYQTKIANANVRISGYAISEEADQIDLFVSLFSDAEELLPVTDSDTKAAADQCLRFLSRCATGKMAANIDESDEAHQLALNIQQHYANLDQIRVYVITDRVAKAKQFQSREINGKTIKLEVMDIERLHRHWSEGKPRDEMIVDFQEVCGGPIPCILIPGDSRCDYALTVFPGEALRFVYEKYGARLLEANVRSFLSASGKVNGGIRKTLKEQPEQFIAFNNGIVVVADEAEFKRTEEGGNGILWLKGMQIVNGGQTTASIYFTKKKNPEVDLGKVRVPAKLIVFKEMDAPTEEGLVSDISRFANSQNSVKLSDLSANKAFHVELEKLSNTTYCPDGVGRWFYERAAGSYNVLMMREGTTPAKIRKLREAIPPARRITKTDLAKFLHAWAQLPHLVSLGSQKNFERFMEGFREPENGEAPTLPDLATYKDMISKAILYKRTQAIVRPFVPAFAANVTTYLVSLLAFKVGQGFNMERIWQYQDLSPQLKQQILTWAAEVNAVLLETAGGRMVSEWAKKPECWEAVRNAVYSEAVPGIPELG